MQSTPAPPSTDAATERAAIVAYVRGFRVGGIMWTTENMRWLFPALADEIDAGRATAPKLMVDPVTFKPVSAPAPPPPSPDALAVRRQIAQRLRGLSAVGHREEGWTNPEARAVLCALADVIAASEEQTWALLGALYSNQKVSIGEWCEREVLLTPPARKAEPGYAQSGFRIDPETGKVLLDGE